MINFTDWELIQKYVTGTSSPEANLKLKEWMEQDPANEELVKEVQKIYELTPDEEFDVNVEEAWERFSHFKIRKSSPSFIKHHNVPRFSDNFTNLLRMAAVILVTLFTGYFTHSYVSSGNNTVQIEESLELEKLITGKGEKARVTFSDGTEVTLNSASSLSFPNEFRSSKREIYLKGEAYLNVAHSEKPFIVHTQNAEVKVLGTKFNIRSWPDDSAADVVVREGKVFVKSSSLGQEESEGVILNRGYYTSVKKDQNPLTPQKVDVRNSLLWLSGGLYFDEKPFKQVITDIERRFNVQIVAPSDLLETSYTGTFQYAELDEILSVISAAMEIGFIREESQIHFK